MFRMWKALSLLGEKYGAHTHSRSGRQPHTPLWVFKPPRSKMSYVPAKPHVLAQHQLSSHLSLTPTGAQKKPVPILEQLIGDIWVPAGAQGPEGCLVWCLFAICLIKKQTKQTKQTKTKPPTYQRDSILFTTKIQKSKFLAWLMTNSEYCWWKTTESCSITHLSERYHKTGQKRQREGSQNIMQRLVWRKNKRACCLSWKDLRSLICFS